MRPDFLDPAVIRHDGDRALAASLQPPGRLVFVLGLARSGTTYLYQLLAERLGLATTQLYHITHYRRLLSARAAGHEAAHRAALDAHLQALGLATRGTDGMPVHAGCLEEYGFILRKFTPHWGLAPGSAALLDALIAKLAALQPEAPGLLLKNPHDLGAIAGLHARYPHARFVVIRRDPLRVLDSQVRAGLRYRRDPSYLDVLMAGTPGWAAFVPAWHASRPLVPDALYARLLAGGLARALARDLAAHHRGLARVPADAVVELTYDALLEAPEATLARLADRLELPLMAAEPSVEPAPRDRALLPEVAAMAPALRRAIGGGSDDRLGR